MNLSGICAIVLSECQSGNLWRGIICAQQKASDSFDLFVIIAYFWGSKQAEASAACYFVGKIFVRSVMLHSCS